MTMKKCHSVCEPIAQVNLNRWNYWKIGNIKQDIEKRTTTLKKISLKSGSCGQL